MITRQNVVYLEREGSCVRLKIIETIKKIPKKFSKENIKNFPKKFSKENMKKFLKKFKWKNIKKYIRKRKAGIIQVLISLLLLAIAAGIGIYIGLEETNGVDKYVNDAYEYYADNNWNALYTYAELKDDDFVNEFFFGEMAKSTYGNIDDSKLVLGEVTEKDGHVWAEMIYTKADGSKDIWKIKLLQKPEKNYIFFNKWKLDLSSVIVKECKVEAPAGFTLYIDGVELTEDNTKKIVNEESNMVTYMIPQMFKGKHIIYFDAEKVEPLEVNVEWNENGSKYVLEQDKLMLDNSETDKMNSNAQIITQLMYKAVFDKSGIDEVMPYFVADETVRAKVAAVYDAMLLSIEPDDGSTLNSMEILEFATQDIKYTYPVQSGLKLSFNCTFKARGPRPQGGGAREKYEGSTSSSISFSFVSDGENWLCNDFDMQCIDYSKKEEPEVAQ